MILSALISEFDQEVESTRRLLQAVPVKDIRYKPSPVSWTMGELAQHIATIYHWYEGTLTQPVYDLTTDRLERDSPDDIDATRRLFERNVEKARAALRGLTEAAFDEPWTMTAGDRIVLGPIPRRQVTRSLLFNHIYHHRGELIIYLRATGNPVPGLYGPTYEELRQQEP